jgi:hydroxyethylthiazole kinase-like uncharacterized protein yjeF
MSERGNDQENDPGNNQGIDQGNNLENDLANDPENDPEIDPRDDVIDVIDTMDTMDTIDALDVMDVVDVVAWEKRIAASGTPLAELMVRAGRAVASYANDLLFDQDPLQSFNDKFLIESIVDARKGAKKIVILCGSGNNGGDGWVAAQELGDQGYDVTLVSKTPASQLAVEPAHTNALKADESSSFEVVIDPDAEELAAILNASNLIIDAILGTGFAYDTVREPYNTWINLANATREEDGSSDWSACTTDDFLANQNTKILAVDCPSGLNAQTGVPANDCIRADLTVTMLAIKKGLIEPSAAPYVGDLCLDRLGVSAVC